MSGYVAGLHRHMNDHVKNNHFRPGEMFYDCTFEKCSARYGKFCSLKRHIIEKHPVKNEQASYSVDFNRTDNIHFDEPTEDAHSSISTPKVTLDEVRKFISLSICRLSSDVSLPHAKVSEVLSLCDSVVHQVSEYLETQVLSFLNEHNVETPEHDLVALKNHFHLDLFSQVNTVEKRTKFLDTLTVSAPAPRDILLNRRQDIRHVNAIPKKVLVNETASYISIIETLKFLFRDPHSRKLLANPDEADTPCVTEFSTFESGELFKTSEFFRNNPNCIRLSLYQDDVELGNAFSSRAGINKVCNFNFKVQNIPEKWNSTPKTVFPLLFCNSIDVKKHGFQKILQPLVADLKKLEGGIRVYYGSEEFLLKAVVTMFCGDTLAVHDVFGLLGPSAKYFCRICQISRDEFHNNPSGEFALRTRDWYDDKLEAVRNGSISSTDSGLKPTGCILNELQNFHITDNFNLDGMHDLAEGVVPLTVQLVLSHYYKQKHLKIDARFINNRINTFCFGYTDRHNKPSANFTNDMLLHPSKHKLKQTSAQTLLLLRAFPFLFGHKVPADCELMVMIGHLINIVRIVISPVVSEHLIYELQDHLHYFEETFYSKFERRINKLHHLKHYAICIQKSGAMKQYNCMQFEQTNKVAKNQASTCKNFKNICHSLAKRQCTKMILNMLDNPFCDNPKFTSGKLMNRNECLCSMLLDPALQHVFVPKTAILNGIEFRANAVIGLKRCTGDAFPSYGIIKEIVVIDGKISFMVTLIETVWYDNFYQAYQVDILNTDELISSEQCFLHTLFSFWSPYDCQHKYISRRFYNRDY